MTEEILKLKGTDAKAFLSYDSKSLSAKEKKSIQDALEYYQNHCDCQFVQNQNYQTLRFVKYAKVENYIHENSC